MNILSDQEILALEKKTPAMNDAGEEWIYFARAIESALLSKLAAGVTVEPVAWMHKETGLIVHVADIAKTSYNEQRIGSGEFTKLYTAATYEAAQRGAERERCAAVCDAALLLDTHGQIVMRGPAKHQNDGIRKCAEAIRVA